MASFFPEKTEVVIMAAGPCEASLTTTLSETCPKTVVQCDKGQCFSHSIILSPSIISYWTTLGVPTLLLQSVKNSMFRGIFQSMPGSSIYD